MRSHLSFLIIVLPFSSSFLFCYLKIAGMSGENKQRFSLCFYLWWSRKASSNNLPRCCSQLYACLHVIISLIIANLMNSSNSFSGFLWFYSCMFVKNDWTFDVWVYTDMSCFQGLFFCSDAASLLLHNFCIYHIDAPGHEVSITISSSLILFYVLTYCLNYFFSIYLLVVLMESLPLCLRVPAAGSCCNFFRYPTAKCWWSGRAGPRSAGLLRVYIKFLLWICVIVLSLSLND